MIRTVLEELERANLVKHEHCSWNVRFGRHTNVQIFVRGQLVYNVKVSKTSVAEEFKVMQLARHALGWHIPEPIGVIVRGALNLLVCKGVSGVFLLTLDRPVRTFLHDYLAASAAHFATSEPGKELVAAAATLWSRSGDAAWSSWFDASTQDRAATILSRLQPVRQHGDFVVENVRRARSRLVIFDWEDFGRVALPGFDLFLLVSSFHNFDPKVAADWFSRHRVEFRRDLREFAGLDFDDFVFLWPLYHLTFYFLKKDFGYRSGIILKINESLNSLVQRPVPPGPAQQSASEFLCDINQGNSTV